MFIIHSKFLSLARNWIYFSAKTLHLRNIYIFILQQLFVFIRNCRVLDKSGFGLLISFCTKKWLMSIIHSDCHKHGSEYNSLQYITWISIYPSSKVYLFSLAKWLMRDNWRKPCRAIHFIPTQYAFLIFIHNVLFHKFLSLIQSGTKWDLKSSMWWLW